MKEWAEWFYKGSRWLHTREDYLTSIDGLCERCSTDDDPVVANIVHHKVYLTPDNIRNAEIAYSWDNLEGLCQTCHNREHHGTKSATESRPVIFDKHGQPMPV